MTRKDFQLIATAMKESKPVKTAEDELHQWHFTLDRLTLALKRSNANFDSSKFLDACGRSLGAGVRETA